ESGPDAGRSPNPHGQHQAALRRLWLGRQTGPDFRLMKYQIQIVLLAALLCLALPFGAPAQGRGGRGGAAGQAAPSPQAAAPIDLTGYWVSLITTRYTYRAVTPPSRDDLYLPLSPDARRGAD